MVRWIDQPSIVPFLAYVPEIRKAASQDIVDARKIEERNRTTEGVSRPFAGSTYTVESEVPLSLYMVVEHFKNHDAVPVYRRFREKGRMMPEGLVYVSSWVDHKFERCYQLMETENRALLDQWMANWSDLIDFEVQPVVTSKEAAEMIAPCLEGSVEE